jgi:arabinose operon protein AraL
VINSSYVLAQHLAHSAPGARLFVLGEPPLLEELRQAGLQIVSDPTQVDYVVAAFDRTFDYAKLYTAFLSIRHGAHFVATNADRTCPIDGGELPDAASVIGDRIETDVKMGIEAGAATALVLTGVTTRAKMAEFPYRPDYVLETIADLIS